VDSKRRDVTLRRRNTCGYTTSQFGDRIPNVRGKKNQTKNQKTPKKPQQETKSDTIKKRKCRTGSLLEERHQWKFATARTSLTRASEMSLDSAALVHYIAHFTTLHHYTTLHDTLLHYTTLYCTTLHYTTLHTTPPPHHTTRRCERRIPWTWC
jgi:hypothetical protein